MRCFLFLLTALVLLIGHLAIHACRHLKLLSPQSMRVATMAWARLACLLLCWICGIRIHLQNDTVAMLNSQAPSLIVANHVSYLDVIVIASLVPALFVCKTEVGSWPLVGWVSRLGGALFVDRSKVQSRLDVLYQIKNSLLDKSVVLFPEGTTTAADVPSVENWLKGNAWAAFRTQVPIIALGLHYEDQEKVAWVGDDEFLPHLLEFFRRDRTDVSISGIVLNSFLPPRALSQQVFQKVVERCEQFSGLRSRTKNSGNSQLYTPVQAANTD